MSQKAEIIQRLKDFGSITTMSAFTQLGITRLAARISELEDDGFEIPRKSIDVWARNGRKCRVTQYQTPTKWP